MSHWKRITNEDTHSATQMEHDQSSYFCRGPGDFCWVPGAVGPILVTGLRREDACLVSPLRWLCMR